MAKPTTKGLLKEIQSEDIERVYIRISEKAIEWAVAGFVAEANNLLENLWLYKLPHPRDLWLPDEGLQVIWKVTNTKPSNVPFTFNNIAAIENENWGRLFTPVWSNTFTNIFIHKSLDELEGNQLFAKVLYAILNKLEPFAVIFQALDKFIKSNEAVGYSYFHATSCASMLAAENGFIKEAERFITLWGKGYSKNWPNYSLSYLMRNRAAAKLLATGILAPIFKITTAICEKESRDIIAALHARLSVGRSLTYGHLSWKQLLKKISTISIKQKTFKFTDKALKQNWLGYPAATSADIENTEKRLGVQFPQDYKSFLGISNGFESISSTDVTISSVDKVDFLINFDKQLVEIYTDAFAEMEGDFCAKFRNSIIVGGRNKEQQLLLIPCANNEWECWFFANWVPGERIYPSFRFYIEELLQQLEDGFYKD